MTRILFCALFLALPVLISTAKNNSDEQKVASMLDDWYKAAATANAEQYFGHFADDAVFLGTDPGERWTLAEFRKLYSKPSWTYVPQERHVSFSADGSTGWFDELLLSPKYGKLRGTGVVVRSGDTWKIRHYSLTFLVPNQDVDKLVTIINQPHDTK